MEVFTKPAVRFYLVSHDFRRFLSQFSTDFHEILYDSMVYL